MIIRHLYPQVSLVGICIVVLQGLLWYQHGGNAAQTCGECGGADFRIDSSEVSLELVSQALVGPARSVKVMGAYAYVATQGALLVYDIGDAANPRLLSTTYVPTVLEDIDVRGGFAFCGSRDGLWIINVFDPSQPVLMESNDATYGALGVEVVGDYAYMGGGAAQVVDVSVPAAPVRVGSVVDHGNYVDVDIEGDFAYFTFGQTFLENQTGLSIVDMSDRSAPQAIREVVLPSGRDVHVEVSDGYAYVGGDSLWVFNVTDPTNPIPEPTLSHAAFDVFEHDGLLYATGGQDVEVFSLSQPDKPVLVGTIPSFARKIDVNAGVAYLASGSLGFVTADVSNPASTVVLAGRPLGGELERVWAFRDVVLAQEEPGWSYRGIHVFDASDPANLVETKFLQGEYAADAALVGSHLFLVSRTPLSPDLPGLRVYQLSEAGPPPLIAGDPTVGSSIEVVDNHIFVLNGEDLSIFEFTDSSINLLATHSIPGAEEFAVDAGLAFVVAGAQGLLVLDVNDPVNLREVGRFDDVFYAWDVEVDGRFAFVADEKVLSGLFLPGVRQIDAADPSNLVEVDSARIGTIRHKGMSTDGQILGVAQAPSDLLVFLADDLGLVGGQDDGYKVGAYTVQDVAVTNGHIFVAYEEAGLHVLRVDSKPVGIDVAAPRPSRPSLHSLDPPYPHPFQRHVTISWTLGRSGWVSLKIVDVLGREVTTSGRQLMAPGRHSYTWAPRGTASGHYFIILEVDGKRVSQTLIRRK